jgi:spore maturation protein CgeB
VYDIAGYNSWNRILNGMASRCVVLCYNSNRTCLEILFKPKEELDYYSSFDKLNMLLKAYAQDKELVNIIGNNAYEIVKKYHTWEHRAKTIINAYLLGGEINVFKRNL